MVAKGNVYTGLVVNGPLQGTRLTHTKPEYLLSESADTSSPHPITRWTTYVHVPDKTGKGLDSWEMKRK
jgi:hypothetical protein